MNKKTKERFLLNTLKKNVLNYFTNKVKTNSKENMWTTFKESRDALSGQGYTKGFVAVNARATNEFANKKFLAYCVNVYLNPLVKQFFINRNIEVKEDEYALSEMIQWIWRSRIRNNEDIYIYMPSSRMRNLLNSWLEEISKG
jgi:hypothetical protein